MSGEGMQLNLPTALARGYLSPSQRVRVMTEAWVGSSIFCPNCGRGLHGFENNKPVADFFCQSCGEEYELKSKNGAMGERLVDGAYATMLRRLRSNNNPNLFYLAYDHATSAVRDFLTIPKYFFVPGIIEKRRPLSATARRAGWIGCNIVLKNVPELGKIFYVRDGVTYPKAEVLAKWDRTEFVSLTRNTEAKGWLLDVLMCVERLNKREFTLEEVYGSERYLQERHPANNNVRAKIRQQLQHLRDRNVLDFIGRGTYRLTSRES